MLAKSSIRQSVWATGVLAAQKASVCRRCAASVREDAGVPLDNPSHKLRRSEIKAMKGPDTPMDRDVNLSTV
jgi:hypothetical protein